MLTAATFDSVTTSLVLIAATQTSSDVGRIAEVSVRDAMRMWDVGHQAAASAKVEAALLRIRHFPGVAGTDVERVAVLALARIANA